MFRWKQITAAHEPGTGILERIKFAFELRRNRSRLMKEARAHRASVKINGGVRPGGGAFMLRLPYHIGFVTLVFGPAFTLWLDDADRFNDTVRRLMTSSPVSLGGEDANEAARADDRMRVKRQYLRDEIGLRALVEGRSPHSYTVIKDDFESAWDDLTRGKKVPTDELRALPAGRTIIPVGTESPADKVMAEGDREGALLEQPKYAEPTAEEYKEHNTLRAQYAREFREISQTRSLATFSDGFFSSLFKKND